MLSKISKTLIAVVVTIAFAASGTAFAAGEHEGGHDEGHDDGHGSGHADAMVFGEPGKASEVDRTIEIVMGDNYFETENLGVGAGETIRFVLKNEGEFLHEFNIGTAVMHVKHQEEMMVMMEHGMLTPTGIDPDMMNMDMGDMGAMHDDPNSVLVEPGTIQELTWKFAAAADLEFACNVPGHYDAGMMGEISFDATR